MAVKIGHASGDENGNLRCGQAGDQSGREVCVRSWYNRPWEVVLRPVPDIAEKIAVACEKGCSNPNIGYDQNQRNTLHTQAKNNGYDLSKVGPCECDCSSFMTVCAIAGGVKSLEYTGNAPTTSTMVKKFTQTGKFTALTASKYLVNDEYLMRGDILVFPGHHTAMALSNGSKARKSIQEIASEVLRGLWGNGAERKIRLTGAGYDYVKVQAEINKQKSVDHISQRGIDYIVMKEGGYKLTAYKLKDGKYYTIGVGHCGPDVTPNMTISRERAEELFKIDIQSTERYVKHYVTEIALTQGRMDALCSYTYNRGAKGLKQLVDNCHTVQEFADGLVKYWGSNQTYKDALIKRRKEEREIFLL